MRQFKTGNLVKWALEADIERLKRAQAGTPKKQRKKHKRLKLEIESKIEHLKELKRTGRSLHPNPLTEPELTEILRYRVKPLMREADELKKRRLYWRAHAKYYAALRELRLALEYRQVVKSSRMMVARGIERRIVSNLQEIEDKIRGRRERISNPVEDITLTVYHATSLRNLGSITRRGILPRKPDFYDKLLRRLMREYRLDPVKVQQRRYYPKWIYEHLEEEIRYAKETRVRLVSFSFRPDYALQNAYAGMEVEAYFRMYLEGLKTGKVRRYNEVYDELVQGRRVALLTIEIDIQDLRLRDQKIVRRIMESEYPLTKIDKVRAKQIYPEQIVGWEIMEKPAWGEGLLEKGKEVG